MTLTNAGLKPFVSRFLKIQLNSDSLSGLSEWLANLRLGQKSLKVVLVEVVDIKKPHNVSYEVDCIEPYKGNLANC